jgi:hypothetical protein
MEQSYLLLPVAGDTKRQIVCIKTPLPGAELTDTQSLDLSPALEAAVSSLRLVRS